MKQFDLEEYLKNPSRTVVTRDGRTVTRFLCTDANGDYPIVALVKNSHSPNERANSYTKDGKYYKGSFCGHDLLFAPEKHEGWVNIYKQDTKYRFIGYVYETKEEAEKNKDIDYITTIKIEWEE